MCQEDTVDYYGRSMRIKKNYTVLTSQYDSDIPRHPRGIHALIVDTVV